jgi:hypothetical protein
MGQERQVDLLCADDLNLRAANVKASVYAYIDVLHVWLKHPLSPERVAWLSGECGWPLFGPPFKVDHSPWWGRSYHQALRLTQPSEEALTWLAERDDALLTYAELAFDFIADEESKLLADVFSQHFVQRWHRSRQTQLFENGNGRTGKRGHVGTNFQWYADLESKLTGEIDCFHLEAQIQGSAALRRLGIDHPRDLFRFDYAAFIRRHLKDAFFTCDCKRLGRHVANKRDGSKRRAPLIDRSDFNRDAATGNVLLRVLGIQGVVDTFGRGRFLSSLCSCENKHHSGRPPTPAQHANTPYRYSQQYHSDKQRCLSAYLRSLTDIEFCYPPHPRCRREYTL